MRGLLALAVLAASLAVGVPVGASPFVAEYVEFVAGVEVVLGLLEASLERLAAGDVEGALALVDRVLEEYYPGVGGVLAGGDPDLAGGVEGLLSEFRGAVERGDVEGARGVFSEVEGVLGGAVEALVPGALREGFIFRVLVVAEVLEAVGEEYEWAAGAGLLEGPLSVLARAEGLYSEIGGLVPGEEDAEVRQLLEELAAAVESRATVERVSGLVEEAVGELEGLVGLGPAPAAAEPLEVVEEIESMLNEILEAYARGDYGEAEELAVAAYLEKYEAIEGVVERLDPELNEEIEELLRDRLRELIAGRAPLGEVESLVAEIRDRLEELESLLEAGGEAGEPQAPAAPAAAGGVPVVWAAALAGVSAIALAELFVIARLRAGRPEGEPAAR